MQKTIDLSKNLLDISKQYPEVIDIMKELGFESITNPGMLNTAGRFMTIPKGAALKNIALDTIIQSFRNKGYEIRE